MDVSMILSAALSAVFPCADSPDRVQTITAGSDVLEMVSWMPVPNEAQSVALENGDLVGVVATPADREFYLENLNGRAGYPEMVRIEIFDLEVEPPVALSDTYGGANSVQKFGFSTESYHTEKPGKRYLRLQLSKPTCVTLESLEASDE